MGRCTQEATNVQVRKDAEEHEEFAPLKLTAAVTNQVTQFKVTPCPVCCNEAL